MIVNFAKLISKYPLNGGGRLLFYAILFLSRESTGTFLKTYGVRSIKKRGRNRLKMKIRKEISSAEVQSQSYNDRSGGVIFIKGDFF